MQQLRLPSLAAVAVVACSACNQPSPAQQAAAGIARLSVRNMGAVATLVNADTTCGFSSTAARASATLEGTVGGSGTLVLRVENCAIDLGSETQVSDTCTGGTTKASGKITVSAVRRVEGRLTGDADTPVIPGSPDAVTIEITEVKFDAFRVENSKSPNKLTITSGTGKATVQPRLAVDATTGACSVSTPNTRFTGVTLTEAEVAVESENAVTGTVHAMNLNAYNGTNGTDENTFSGTIDVSSRVGFLPPNMRREYELPLSNDEAGSKLDPDYDAAKFKEEYVCAGRLETESYVCADLAPRLADGAARLSVKLFGAVTSLVDKNNTCGFSTPAVAGAAQVSGTVGGTGSITMSITDCTIMIPADTTVSQDCTGTPNVLGGQVKVTGTKIVAGRLTGDAASPVIPMSDSPATFNLTITMEGFKVNSGSNSLNATGGTLVGMLQPRVALAGDTGACSVASPIARFTDLVWTNGAATLGTDNGAFNLAIATSDLDAVNGTWDADSNELSGSLTLEGASRTIPSDGAGLDPAFSQTAFDASWQCAATNAALVIPAVHQCVFIAPLAQGISRLTARNVGTALSLVNAASTTCGFAGSGGNYSVTGMTGNLGDDDSTLTLTLTNPCTIPFTTETVVSSDCTNPTAVTTSVQGTVVVTGSKTVSGFMTGDPAAPIVPTSRDPAVFNLTMTFTDFRVTKSNSTSSLTIKDGTIAAVLTPRTALDTTTGACSVSTPILAFDNMTYGNSASVRLVSDGKTFDVEVGASDLDAQNGTKDAVSNQLTGSITVDTVQLAIPVQGADNKLDPEFTQAAFDDSYDCTPNMLVPPDEATCSFRRALATGIAQLMVKNVGVATSLTDGNPVCGFKAAPGASPAPTYAFTPASPGAAGTALELEQTLIAAGCTTPAPSSAIPTCITMPAAVATSVEGSVLAKGTKHIGDGTNTTAISTGNASAPIAPTSRTAATFTFSELNFTNFGAYTVVGTAAPTAKLVVSGAVAAVVNPVAGQSTSLTSAFSTPIYSISTPVASISNITATNVQATLTSGPKTFKVTINTSDLDAFNGTYFGQSNALSGSITLDGQVIPIAATALDPAFSQASFDASYSCTADLTAVIPSA